MLFGISDDFSIERLLILWLLGSSLIELLNVSLKHHQHQQEIWPHNQGTLSYDSTTSLRRRPNNPTRNNRSDDGRESLN